VSRIGAVVALAGAAAAAYVVERARRIAEEEDRPLADVLRDMPGRLRSDVTSLGDDIREAAEEGKSAAARREREIDEEIQAVRSREHGEAVP
jgi:hypothetical protein